MQYSEISEVNKLKTKYLNIENDNRFSPFYNLNIACQQTLQFYRKKDMKN